MKANTTQDLINDMETIRTFFNIDKWAVFGGSWGSALALLYAEAHPQKVLGLVLRGIFLVRDYDISAFVRDNSPAALLHSKEWATFKNKLKELITRADRPDLSIAKDPIYHIVYELLQHTDVNIKNETAGLIATWEKLNSYLEVNKEDIDWGSSSNGVNMGLTEATYFEHGCYIEPNKILNNLSRLEGIPTYIVQGKYDLVCPPYMADELEDALSQVNNQAENIVTRFDTLAGHSHKQSANISALIESTDALALRYEALYSKKKVSDSDLISNSMFHHGALKSDELLLPSGFVMKKPV